MYLLYSELFAALVKLPSVLTVPSRTTLSLGTSTKPLDCYQSLPGKAKLRVIFRALVELTGSIRKSIAFLMSPSFFHNPLQRAYPGLDQCHTIRLSIPVIYPLIKSRDNCHSTDKYTFDRSVE